MQAALQVQMSFSNDKVKNLFYRLTVNINMLMLIVFR